MPHKSARNLFSADENDRIVFRILIAALIALNIVITSAVVLGIKQVYDQNIKEAKIRSQNLALAIDLTLSAEIEKIDLSLKSVIADLERFNSGRTANDWRLVSSLLEQQKSLLPEVEGWSIADANGQIFLHHGDTRFKYFSVADRNYFKTLQTDTTARLLVAGPVISRASGEFVLIFARRIINHAGEFSGAVLIAFPMSYINRAMSGYDVGPRGTLTLRNRDLEIITRVITDQRGDISLLPGESLSAEFVRLVSSGITRATYTSEMPFDKVERIASYRKLSSADLYTIVGISKTDQLKEWREIAWRFFGFLTGFLFVANGSAWLLYRLLQHQHRSTELLRESNEHLESSLRQLRERDSALVSAQQAGRLGTYTLDMGSGRWTSSEMLDTIFGIEASPLHSIDDWKNLLHEDDKEPMAHYFHKDVIGKRQDFDREYRISRPCDGQTIWVHGLGRLEFGEDGHPTRMRGTVRDITALKVAQQNLERMAYYDVLTGLANRALLTDRMRQAIRRCRRNEGDLIAICHLDLDSFKEVNDRWGHGVGDALLASVAERFRDAVRSNDTVARLGGDEFVVIFSDLKDVVSVEHAVSRLLESAGEPHNINGIVLSSTVSIGVTIYPLDAEPEPDALIRHADQAMYDAKRSGKNRIHFFDPENDRLLKDRQEKHQRIVDALANNELRLFYQPKVDLRSGLVIGVEALLRWQHPEQGLLLPGQFLPTIESSELTLPVGEWVLHEAIGQWKKWQSQGVQLTISINVFALHLQRPDFPERLKRILQSYPGFPPESLELEILETTALGDINVITRRVELCTGLGVQFSLDDFGTGYSSLTYLRNLPVATVKIDRSFVSDMLVDPEDQALVQGLIAMAHAVRRNVVAEGVETIDHATALLRCGCDQVQGFGIGRPMPAEAIPDWLATWQAPAEWTLHR